MADQFGRKRFPDGKEFRRYLLGLTRSNIGDMVGLLPSNYPKDFSTNVALLFRAVGEELARIRLSANAISNDKVYNLTRIEYLHQILGMQLFLFDRLTPQGYSDEKYRTYLTSIKTAYLNGSSKATLETLASVNTGLQVRLQELYLEARDPASALSVKDTHKMRFDVLISDLAQNVSIVSLEDDIKFYINLVKPAHTLFDVRFIWTEQLDINKVYDVYFGDTGGGCIPSYDYIGLPEPTYVAKTVNVTTPATSTGLIDSIHHDDRVFYLTSGFKIIVTPDTRIFNINGIATDFESLQIGQYVKLNLISVPGDFQFGWKPQFVIDNWQQRFYKQIYQRPAFQETVKKLMDANGRFPLTTKTTPTTLCDRWVQDVLVPQYEDLRKFCGDGTSTPYSFTHVLSQRSEYPKLAWPYPSQEFTDRILLGNDYSFKLPSTPVIDSSTVSVFLDGTSITDSVQSVASDGRLDLIDSSSNFWRTSFGRNPLPGDTFRFDYHYSNDGTDTTTSTSYDFGVSFFQTPYAPLVKGDSTSGLLAEPSDIQVTVDGTSVTGAVQELNPLLGHIVLNSYTDFWTASELGRLPTVDDTMGFSFYYGFGYRYEMLFDTDGRVFDEEFCFDGDSGSGEDAVSTLPAEIGYRYRAYLLHHSSVWNSPDTFEFNGFQKPANRASLINQQHSFNHMNLFFSPEFLTDKNPVKELNDEYLLNGLDPVLKLHEGTPPFQKTFSYHPGLVYDRNLTTIRQHRHPLMYSDLLLREFREENDGVPLSSICDRRGFGFKIRMTEDLSHIKECDDWILFDTGELKEVDITLPGITTGHPNLRVAGMRLRNNFILRERSSTGIYEQTYTTLGTDGQSTIQLPATVVKQAGIDFPSTEIEYGTLVDVPALPIMKDSVTPAGPGDITVTVDGNVVPVSALNANTGLITLGTPLNEFKRGYTITLTQLDIDYKAAMLEDIPLDVTNVTVTVYKGTAQYYPTDFFVSNGTLRWAGCALENLLAAGDKLIVQYITNPTIVVTYYITTNKAVEIIDEDRSRVFDDEDVFPGNCPTLFNLAIRWPEYVNVLSDYAEGIKFVYLNKDNYQVEEHSFTGPLFEITDGLRDEIGSPESFPNALVRIPQVPIPNPLGRTGSLGFLNEPMIRIKHRIFKELLPNRSFRTTEVLEATPV